MGKVTKMKDAVCIDCGVAIEINVLASLKTARCAVCKTGGKFADVRYDDEPAAVADPVDEPEPAGRVTVYGESMTGPRIDGAPNKALARLACPYHPHKTMNVIGVIRNDHWGDIVSMQCREKGCWTVIQISEQSRISGPWRTTVDGTTFEPEDLLESVRGGSLSDWAREREIEVKQTKGI
jgi:hypothetical protein